MYFEIFVCFKSQSAKLNVFQNILEPRLRYIIHFEKGLFKNIRNKHIPALIVPWTVSPAVSTTGDMEVHCAPAPPRKTLKDSESL